MSSFKSSRYKRSFITSAVVLAAFVLVTGCEAPASTTTSDGFFSADFVSVNSQILPPVSVPPGSPTPVSASDSSITAMLSISGRGTVAQAVIDPPGPVPTATPLLSTSGSGSTGNPIQVDPPIYLGSQLVLDFSSGIFSDDCLAKAAQAAAQGLHLLVQGEGQVTRWADAGTGASGSGTGSSTGPSTGTGPVTSPPVQIGESGAFIQASKITSCELGLSICAEAEVCMLPPASAIACPVGAMCVPPPCQCQPGPTPAPLPTATPLAS